MNAMIIHEGQETLSLASYAFLEYMDRRNFNFSDKIVFSTRCCVCIANRKGDGRKNVEYRFNTVAEKERDKL